MRRPAAAPAIAVRSDSRYRRGKMARATRIAGSTRSTYLPSQNKLSATRLGRSNAERVTVCRDAEGGRRLNCEVGSDAITQVSLLPPPLCIDVTKPSTDVVTRVSPPGMTL